jgi:hypothetical protein
MEEHAFVIETMYNQTMMENKTKHNNPLMMVVDIKIR